MECNVCLQRYDSKERRPKVVPVCGHSFCLRCLKQLGTKACPLDGKVFKTAPESFVDNFGLIQALNMPPDPSLVRLWCRRCNKDGSEGCADDHPVCSLKRARLDDSGLLLGKLQQGEAGLDALQDALDVFAEHLEQEKVGLAAARDGLQKAQQEDLAAWELAKEAAERAGVGVFRAAAALLADLADARATCSVAVRRGEDGAVAWSGEVRPAEDVVARLLLGRLACVGALQQPRDPPPSPRPAVPRWRERSNERVMTPKDMWEKMVVGSRVVRGVDWAKGCVDDGTPPGPGTVVSKEEYGSVHVKWDKNSHASSRSYDMGYQGKYKLSLLSPEPWLLKPQPRALEGDSFLDVEPITSRSDYESMSQMLASSLAQVRRLVGLPCSAFPPWSLKLLRLVAPRLEGLQMVSPLPQHLQTALEMPNLQALSITGVTGDHLRQVSQMASLRRLELHCPLAAPLPVLSFPAVPAGLLWLRCGVHPLATALALVRAHAATLEELQLVAASTEPYGCPDLAGELRHCQLKKLKRMVLLRETGEGEPCGHDVDSCKVQSRQLWNVFVENDLTVTMLCSECDKAKFQKANVYCVC